MEDRQLYARFLAVVGQAHDQATPDQRCAIRAVAAQQLPMSETIRCIETIMGWDA